MQRSVLLIACLVLLVGIVTYAGSRIGTRVAAPSEKEHVSVEEAEGGDSTDGLEDVAEVVDLEAEEETAEDEWVQQADASILEGDEVDEIDEAVASADVVDEGAADVEPESTGETDDAPAADAETDEPLFVMPEEADYEPEVALISVPEGMTAAELDELVATVDGVTGVQASDEDLASGLVKVELAPDTSVEDAVNELLGSGAVEGAQPNYRYQAAGAIGTAADLRALMGAALLRPASVTDDEVTVLESASTEGEDVAAEVTADDATADTDVVSVSDTDEATAALDTDASEEIAATEDPAIDDAADEEAEIETVEDDESTEAVDALDATTVAEATDEAEEAIAEAEDDEDAEDADAKDESENESEEKLGAAALVADLVDDKLVYKQWHLDSIKAADAWNVVKTDGDVTVAILDLGFNVSHEDLKANVVSPYNAYNKTTDVSVTGTDHGTHVAGIVAACANNGKGVVGTSYNARVMPIKVVDSSLMASTETLVRAYTYVMNRANTYNVRVINLSMAMAGEASDLSADDELLAAMDEAYEAGIVTVCAAGNSGLASPPYICYPADYDTVVSVINIDKNLSRSSTSNYNDTGETCKNISAPGTSVYSTTYSSYGTMSGTSMASPVVAGVLTLEFAALPSLSADQAVQILYSSATDIGASGWDEQTGYGEVNALEAVADVKHGVLSGPSYLAAGKTGTYSMAGSDSSFSYSSSNTSVATVTAAGKVTAKAAGTTTITATCADDGVKRTMKLTVFGAITGASSLAVPSTTTYKVTKPVSAAWKWKSSDTSVAKVGSSSGVVTAVSPGTATITATLVADASVKLTKTVTVSQGNIANATISSIADKTYTGKAIKVYPTVKMGSTQLVRGTDYTLAYTSNKAIGTAYVTIKGKGSYTGSKKVSFKIVEVAPTANLTGWHSPDLGKTYYWYSKGTKRTKAGWIVTKRLLDGGTGTELQRYWVGESGKLARNRLVKPSEGSGYWAYARSTGYVVRGRCKVGKRVYFANNDGKLLSPGWHTSSAYGQGKQRYYIEKSTRSAVLGYSTSGYAHYTTAKGYVLRGAGRTGSIVYLANAKTGKLVNHSGWYVATGVGQGLQRYYLHAQSNGAYAAQVGYSKAGYAHYTTKKGYVLVDDTLKASDGYTYKANGEGRITSRKKS